MVTRQIASNIYLVLVDGLILVGDDIFDLWHY